MADDVRRDLAISRELSCLKHALVPSRDDDGQSSSESGPTRVRRHSERSLKPNVGRPAPDGVSKVAATGERRAIVVLVQPMRVGVCFWLLAGPITGLALTANPAENTQVPQFRTQINLVPVAVRVVDERGWPIRDLRKTDFEIREDGRVQEIAHFEKESSDADRGARGRAFVIVCRTSATSNAPDRRPYRHWSNSYRKSLPSDRVGS